MSETANALNEFKKRRDEARRNYAKVLRIVSNVDIELRNIQDLDTQRAKVDGLAGEAGSVHQLVQLLNQKLDALSAVKSENGMPPEEILPQETAEVETEIGMGGEPDNMVEAPMEIE